MRGLVALAVLGGLLMGVAQMSPAAGETIRPPHERMLKYTIFYKSGHKIQVKASNLRVTWITRNSRVTEMHWTTMIPQPNNIGLANIESVWDGWV